MLSHEELIGIIKINPNVEKAIVGILLTHNLVNYDKIPKEKDINIENNLLKNVSIVGKVNLPIIITLDKSDSYRNLFPVGLKGTPIIVHKKLQRFFNTDGKEYTFEQLMEATKQFIDKQLAQSGVKYIYNCNNIIYKQEKNKEEKSPILDILDTYLSYKKSTLKEVDPDFIFDLNN